MAEEAVDEKAIRAEFKKNLKQTLRLCEFDKAIELAEGFKKEHEGQMKIFTLHWLNKTYIKACKIL